MKVSKIIMNIPKLVTLGADPEFFLENKKGVFPAVGIIEGTKQDPQPLPVGKGFFLQRDGLLAEGNIPPAKNKAEFIEYMGVLKDSINKVVESRGLKIGYYDSARFMPRFLQLPEAFEFGCEPYINSWNSTYSTRAYITKLNRELADIDRRPAGFHIHIGVAQPHLLTHFKYKVITCLFDLFITNPLREVYNDLFRAKYYGQLGSYRVKSYGVECRSLGSYFTQNKYLGYIWNQVEKMFDYYEKFYSIFLSGFASPEQVKLLDYPFVDSPHDSRLKEGFYEILNTTFEEQTFKKQLVYA